MNKIQKKISLILFIILLLKVTNSCECNNPDSKKDSKKFTPTSKKVPEIPTLKQNLSEKRKELKTLANKMRELTEVIDKRLAEVDKKIEELNKLIAERKEMEAINKLELEIDEERKAIKKLQNKNTKKLDEMTTNLIALYKEFVDIIKNMLMEKSYTIDDIIEVSGLSKEEIEKIALS